MKNKINIILGTTASGKTKFGVQLAEQIDGIVINCDSMQVYKEIPILTAQPTKEEKRDVEHRLYGYVSCIEHFSVGHWLKNVVPEIKDVLNKGRTPILVGGTGMYVKSLMDGISPTPDISQETKEFVKKIPNRSLHAKLLEVDPKTGNKLTPNDHQRIIRALEVFFETGKSLLEWQENAEVITYLPKKDFHLIKIDKPREEIYQNIDKRFLEMVESGVVDEVAKLYNEHGNITYPKAHGLPEIIAYINGDITLAEAIATAQKKTRNYAKRQITWMNNQVKFDEVR